MTIRAPPESLSFRAQYALARQDLHNFSHPSRRFCLEPTYVIEHEHPKDLVTLRKAHIKNGVGYRPRDELLLGTGYRDLEPR